MDSAGEVGRAPDSGARLHGQKYAKRVVLSTMTGMTQRLLYELAEDQYGFVTTDAAAAVGVPSRRLAELAHRGTLDHVSRGVYRLAQFPPTPFDEYMAATLWPRGARAVVSHESVLELLELCDVNPARIHLTVPAGHRPRRNAPTAYELHRAQLAEHEIAIHEGVAITTVKRAVRDCLALGTGRHLLADAVDAARRRGLLTAADAAELTDLIGPIAHPRRAAGA